MNPFAFFPRSWLLAAALLVGGAFSSLGVYTLVLKARETRAVEAAFARGVESGKSATNFDAALRVGNALARTVMAERDARQAQAALDSALARTATRGATVRGVGARVPQIIRDTVPVVDTLVVESAALARDVDSLRASVQTERAATGALRDTLTGVVHAQAIVAAEWERRATEAVAAARARVSKVWATVGAVLSAILGFFVGREL